MNKHVSFDEEDEYAMEEDDVDAVVRDEVGIIRDDRLANEATLQRRSSLQQMKVLYIVACYVRSP